MSTVHDNEKARKRRSPHSGGQPPPSTAETEARDPQEAGEGLPPIERVTTNEIQVGAGGTQALPNAVVDSENNRPTSSTVPTSAGTAEPAPDPFDPANLRLSQDFTSTGGVKKHITSVPARKPTREEWLRVHPSPAYTLDTLVLELKDSRECYLIAPALWGELATEPTVTPRRLHLAMNRDGTPFIWPLRLPPAEGRQDRWSESALMAAEAAKDSWVRLQANMGLGAYVYDTPLGELPPPQWSEMSFAEILKLAFRSNFIDTRDHMVLRRLRGEV